MTRGRLKSFLPSFLLCLSGCGTISGLVLTGIGVTDGDNGAALPVPPSDDPTLLEGVIYPFGDYDIFELGAGAAGDVLRLECQPGLLRAGFLLVDADSLELLDGYDGNSPGRSGIETVLRRNVARLRVYVGPGHARIPPIQVVPFPLHGPYRISVRRVAEGAAPPAPRPQTVVLDFRGGRVTRYYDVPITLAPFTAADYGLAGQDVALRQAIRERVAQIFADFDVRILTSDDPPPLDPVSVVYFTRPGFFNVAGRPVAGGQVRYYDFRNRDAEDVAIVSHSAHRYSSLKSAGRSFGLTAAHEIGHLLGLLHQQSGLMSYQHSDRIVSGPLVGYFGFVAGERDAALFPPAPQLSQPARELLLETVGPR